LDDDVTPIRVLVVDDQYLMREGLATLLQRDRRLAVVGRGKDGQEAVDLAARLLPDVVLLDIRMPVLDGIQATRQIKARWPQVRIVILTSFVNDGYVVQGLAAGADGYLLKDATPEALVSGVLAVAAGKSVLETDIARRVAHLLGDQAKRPGHQAEGLTVREIELLTMVSQGLLAKDIARALHISEKTVRNHMSSIYHKLGIFDRSQAVLWAIRNGLVPAE
jgi:DNA-binding NarL/FixJ family response regulator